MDTFSSRHAELVSASKADKKIPKRVRNDTKLVMIKKQLEIEIKKIIDKTLGLEDVWVVLEHPANESFGDYSSSVAIKISKSLGQSPLTIAKRIIDQLYKSEKIKSLGVEKIELAGPGFINFYLKKDILVAEIQKILLEKENYGHQEGLRDKKIMIEFAHPNTHKQFHIGHLRNISLGESLVRLHEASGAAVIRANYQGDVGLHVAKALWGITESSKFKVQSSKLDEEPLLERIEFLGQCYVEGNKAYEGDKKEEVVAINKKIYAKDPEVMLLWEKTRVWSLEYFDWIYKRLGTHYDRLFFESEVAGPGAKIAKEALEKGILIKSEGAVIFDGTPYGLDKRVFLNSEGLPTYEAKELGLAGIEFSEFGLIDRLIHVVGPEQQSFFKVTFKVEELLDPKKYGDKQFHFVYGYVRLKEGKMSSRKGNVVTALSVIEEAKQQIRQLVNLSHLSNLGDLEAEEIAEKVAVGAVKYSLLKSDAKNDIAFDLGQSIALEGNSGPYLQYTYARALSVLRKSQITNSKSQTNSKIQNSKFHPSVIPDRDLGSRYLDSGSEAGMTGEELALLRTLYKFPEVVESAALQYSPHLICNFLFDLAQKFNQFYNNVSILPKDSSRVIPGRDLGSRSLDAGSPSGMTNGTVGMTDETSNFRLALTAATAQVIKNGLDLLGIEAPERM